MQTKILFAAAAALLATTANAQMSSTTTSNQSTSTTTPMTATTTTSDPMSSTTTTMPATSATTTMNKSTTTSTSHTPAGLHMHNGHWMYGSHYATSAQIAAHKPAMAKQSTTVNTMVKTDSPK